MHLLNICCNSVHREITNSKASTYTVQQTQMAYMTHMGFETVTLKLEPSETVGIMERSENL
jgi:hypothetical protein